MHFNFGFGFENAVFDVSDFEPRKEGATFTEALEPLVEKEDVEFPRTLIGTSLFFLVKNELEKLGIETDGLIFRSSVHTEADYSHYTDGFFFLPSLPDWPITIDLFNLDSKVVQALWDLWFMEADGDYSVEQFQTDLFLQKKGLYKFKLNQSEEERGIRMISPVDFRSLTDQKRPENHFILTPLHIQNPKSRKKFAQMVAQYFARVAKRKGRQIMAQQSP